jgi:hypothetical protein
MGYTRKGGCQPSVVFDCENYLKSPGKKKREEKKGLSSLKWIDFESGGETRKR